MGVTHYSIGQEPRGGTRGRVSGYSLTISGTVQTDDFDRAEKHLWALKQLAQTRFRMDNLSVYIVPAEKAPEIRPQWEGSE